MPANRERARARARQSPIDPPQLSAGNWREATPLAVATLFIGLAIRAAETTAKKWPKAPAKDGMETQAGTQHSEAPISVRTSVRTICCVPIPCYQTLAALSPNDASLLLLSRLLAGQGVAYRQPNHHYARLTAARRSAVNRLRLSCSPRRTWLTFSDTKIIERNDASEDPSCYSAQICCARALLEFPNKREGSGQALQRRHYLSSRRQFALVPSSQERARGRRSPIVPPQAAISWAIGEGRTKFGRLV